VYSPDLEPLAQHHFGRRKIQPSREELRAFYQEAQQRLAHPVLWWDNAERQALAEAFGQVVREYRLTCYACAVMRNHVHVLLRKHRLKAEDMSARLKERGRDLLREGGLAAAEHPIFSESCCHLFKSDVDAMRNCVAYIESNFQKHGIPRNTYDFVTPYDGWGGGSRRR
jgi:REP element-mobilizing transposase RayT